MTVTCYWYGGGKDASHIILQGRGIMSKNFGKIARGAPMPGSGVSLSHTKGKSSKSITTTLAFYFPNGLWYTKNKNGGIMKPHSTTETVSVRQIINGQATSPIKMSLATGTLNY